MFIGWIRQDRFKDDIKEFAKSKIIDENLILNTVLNNNTISFGAYDDGKLISFITIFVLDKRILINNFYYLDNCDDSIKIRMIKLVLNNINIKNKSIMILVSNKEKKIFNDCGFKEYSKFYKAIYGNESVAFNFSNSMSKSINNENYLNIIKQIDKRCFGDDRFEYLINYMFKQSSLVLSTSFGYQHSYGLDKNIIKISPWVMEDAAYSDAQKILRGVIYHRGLKKIVAFIPSEITEITDLYKSYKFDFVEDFYLMYQNEKPNINLEMLYAL